MTRLAQLDHAHVWHPFTQMRDWLRSEPRDIVSGQRSGHQRPDRIPLTHRIHTCLTNGFADLLLEQVSRVEQHRITARRE